MITTQNGTPPRSVWQVLPTTWKTLVTIAGIALAGGAAIGATAGLLATPELAQRNAARIEYLEAEQRGLATRIDELTEQVMLGNCLDLAERRGTNWRECLSE